jgi:hypothetical protein
MMFREVAGRYSYNNCCMDGYSIDAMLDVMHQDDLWNISEVQFLEKYQCVASNRFIPNVHL